MIYRVAFLLTLSVSAAAQYAPPAGTPGTTAIHRDSAIVKSWATGCQVTRGPQEMGNSALENASAGEASNASGKADGSTVSLGDGGSAICTFQYPIINGPGPDFAVFENSITDDFLELAFVEVSSDGQTFFRFRAHSLSDTVNQTGSFGSTDAVKINNLAGKYRAGYGTPFDLEELAGQPGLDVNAVSHVRIVDVVGSLNPAFARRDGYGNKINDPWPTPFPSSGFDLDAVAVIHQATPTGPGKHAAETLCLSPNPVKRGETFSVSGAGVCGNVALYNAAGALRGSFNALHLSTDSLEEGFYFVVATLGNGETVRARLLIY